MNDFPVIRDRKIRLGIVGCGRIAKNHFAAMEKHAADLQLVAICDIDQSVLHEHITRLRVPGYRRIDEMIAKESLDIVVLCTPSGLHPEQTIVAAAQKVNVVTEKPMATRTTKATAGAAHGSSTAVRS